ncbi:hypothetical protein EVAR_88384_1 [Eumeta japonica]|uniref:Uncharacterized protein n=1 Tax=Eumeta variegata TaxID=151549 RepID=A0A4C1XA53_EUMVA|nr:hypothetical protein EVAR_88384_1 [Eumeta japonica]
MFRCSAPHLAPFGETRKFAKRSSSRQLRCNIWYVPLRAPPQTKNIGKKLSKLGNLRNEVNIGPRQMTREKLRDLIRMHKVRTRPYH